MAKKQSSDKLVGWGIVAAGAVLAVALVAAMVVWLQAAKPITNFAQCREAGGAIMESYPEQCALNGATFVNQAQLGTGAAYVGTSEKEALAKAAQENTPARVVERDGKGLPLTMDFAFGRHNFYVKDDKVYRVQVEGQAVDSPAQE